MTVNIVEGSIIDIDNEVFFLLISHSSRKPSSIFINTCTKLVLLFGIGVRVRVRTSCSLQSADIRFRGNLIVEFFFKVGKQDETRSSPTLYMF